MSQFWLPMIALCGLAGIFVIWPFYRSRQWQRRVENDQRERLAQNVAIFKERQGELQQDLAAGRIDAQECAALELELERTLLEDADKLEFAAGEGRGVPALGITLVLFAALLAASFWWYDERGAYDALAQRDAMQFSQAEMAAAQAAAEAGDMSALVEQLYSKLKTAPDNLEGWSLLARTAMNMERYDLAAEAYENIIRGMEQQDANPAPVYGLLAQARYFGGEGSMTRPVTDALNMALTLDENESNALGLLAIDAFQQQRYEAAIAYWQRILEANPEHPARASIEAGIARASQFVNPDARSEQLIAPNPLANVGEEASEGNGGSESGAAPASIRVTVDIEPSLRAQLQGNESVFVFARAVSGPPMPLAASRHSVTELPLTIELSDALAMSPAAKLSDATSVDVVARVSMSGQPIAQPGDFEGRQSAIATRENVATSITIDQRL